MRSGTGIDEEQHDGNGERPDGERFTVEQLAHRVGITVRNIRAYQSSGLLPAPVRRGKVAWYGLRHERQLEKIKGLREQGFGLAAIADILIWSGDTPAGDILGYTRALLDGFGSMTSLPVPPEQQARWGAKIPPELISRMLRTGLYQRIDDDTYQVVSPVIDETARELAVLGVPVGEAVALLEALHEHTSALAARYVATLVRCVARPMAQGSGDPDRLRELRAALERLVPLATASVHAAMPVALREQFDRAVRDTPSTGHTTPDGPDTA